MKKSILLGRSAISNDKSAIGSICLCMVDKNIKTKNKTYIF